MSLNIGRKGRLYVVKEAGAGGGNGAGYGQKQDASNGANTLSAAANAVRHTDFKFSFNPFNRANSTEKKTSPGQAVVFDRRATANLDSIGGLIRPSGVLNTLPEADKIFEAAFGSKSNVTLSTTINDAAATTTSATLTSVVGLVIGTSALLFVVAGKKYVRFVTNVVGSVVTWAPALPAAPANVSAVKSGIVYKLTTDLAISLAALHVLPGFRRECRGIGIDKFTVTLDNNAEPMFSASGPAQTELNDANAVADPGTFTVVGSQNPPSGIVGDVLIGGTSYLSKKASVDLSNGLRVRNEEFGANAETGLASEVFRDGRRSVGVSLDAFVETAATVHDFAIAGTQKSFFAQNGRTEGNIVALYCPIVNWNVPDTDAPDSASNWSFKGTALESSDGANDEFYLALM
jgi:hypothetical protein